MTPKQKNRPEEGRQVPAPVPAPARPTDPTEACITDAQTHLRSGVDTLRSDHVSVYVGTETAWISVKTPPEKQGLENNYVNALREREAARTVALQECEASRMIVLQEHEAARTVAIQERDVARMVALGKKQQDEKPILAKWNAELQALEDEIRTTRYPDTAAYDRAKAELP